jgi:purine nucleosidase
MAAYVRRPVIIDTDPGTDDAIAILFALGSAEQLDVRALTAVAGNVSLELAQRNARVVRDWADRTDLPVYAGCARPLKG